MQYRAILLYLGYWLPKVIPKITECPRIYLVQWKITLITLTCEIESIHFYIYIAFFLKKDVDSALSTFHDLKCMKKKNK